MDTDAPKILIVEDRVALEGRELERVLVEAGYDVIGIADTRADAVEMARTFRPLIAIVDVDLDSDGDTAGAEAARTIQSQLGTQIIFVTGAFTRNMPRLLTEILKTPDHQFLTKPVDEVQLLASVKRAVVKTRSNRVVFLCYSRKDRKFADEWQAHMTPLQEVGISTWSDLRQIPIGEQWRRVLDENLANVNAAVCLVSINFINSRFISEVEWPVIRSAGQEKSLPIVPVFVGSVDPATLDRRGILAFQSINDPSDPIAKWTQERRASDCWAPLCSKLQQRMR